jgi:hypothetical protein
MQKFCEESCSPDQFEQWEALKSHLLVTRRNLREPRRYWQHGETGRIATTENAVDLSDSYGEISEENYLAIEIAQQSVQRIEASLCSCDLPAQIHLSTCPRYGTPNR